KFTLPESHNKVVLDIYDVTGRKLQTVYEGSVEGGKTYTYKVDASLFGGTLFIARLNASGKTYTLKLLKGE
ncbi:MAG: hypothetical protein H7Y07_11870, partial [Pyrinomonadaceae bacterium]|nr:hypothetical protein [Sphingobacteriaceae bacterium]